MSDYKLIELFDLEVNYTKSQLDQSYKDLVQIWHPDKYAHNKRLQTKAAEKLKEINLAYAKLKENLANTNKRTQFRDNTQRNTSNKYTRSRQSRKRKTSNRNDIKSVFHPTDFTRNSEVAFLHALKISLIAETKLNILHFSPKKKKIDWSNFPRIRKTLANWKISKSADNSDGIGLHVKKVVDSHKDPVLSTLKFLKSNPTDLIVLATNQRKGADRWLTKSISEPIARQSGEMTLFIPKGSEGFISHEDGSIKLKRILIPLDYKPDPQVAVDAAYSAADFLSCSSCHFILVHVNDKKKFPKVKIKKRENWKWGKINCSGEVVEQIIKTAKDNSADLIVMSTEGRDGFLDALRGSTTERVLRESGCPLLAVPST